MVYINVITPFLAMVLVVIKFGPIGYQFYKDWKAQKSNKVKEISKQNEISSPSLSSRKIPVPHKIYPKPKNINSGAQVLDINQSFDVPINQNNSFIMTNLNNSTIIMNPVNRKNLLYVIKFSNKTK